MRPGRSGAHGGPILPYAIYAVLYASTSDSRWHESGHGTAFKTDWMNNALYEIASFMVMRESTVWRWSHNRHHSDTIIVGRDPEIAVPRPPDLTAISMAFFNLRVLSRVISGAVLHALLGRMSAAEKTFIPATEFHAHLSRRRASTQSFMRASSRSRFTSAAFCRCCSSGCQISSAPGSCRSTG